MTSPLSSVQNELRLRRAPGVGVRATRPEQDVFLYPAGSYVWVCPADGEYRLALWGAGGGSDASGNTGGGSGALYIATRRFSRGHAISVVSGAGGGPNANGAASTVTLPNGEVLTAGGGQFDGTPGAVTANRQKDIVFPGSAGGVSNGAGGAGLGGSGGAGGAGSGSASGGAGAPGYGALRGGDGQPASIAKAAETPGGGKAVNTSVFNPGFGGDGLVIISWRGP